MTERTKFVLLLSSIGTLGSFMKVSSFGSVPSKSCKWSHDYQLRPKPLSLILLKNHDQQTRAQAQSAGVASEVNLQITKVRKNARDPPWLWNPGRRHQKPKTGVSVGHKKDLCPAKFKKKKPIQHKADRCLVMKKRQSAKYMLNIMTIFQKPDHRLSHSKMTSLFLTTNF